MAILLQSSPRMSLVSRRRLRAIASKGLVTLLIIPGALLFLAPFLWMLSTSLKSPELVYKFPPQIIPNPVLWENYVEAMTRLPWHVYAWNTIQMTILSLIGHLLTASLAAYAFSRLRFRGRDIWFFILLSTVMLPPQVTLIPTFLIFRYLHWIDTLKPIWAPDWLGGAPFSVFLLRQFMSTLPIEMDEAARIEGCNYFDIYWRIILPLIKPALAAVAIFVFLWCWNDIYYSVIYLNSRANWTLPLGLNYLRRSDPMHGHRTEMEILMAASVVIMMPCLVIFFLAQRYFIQGIVFTGVKG